MKNGQKSVKVIYAVPQSSVPFAKRIHTSLTTAQLPVEAVVATTLDQAIAALNGNANSGGRPAILVVARSMGEFLVDAAERIGWSHNIVVANGNQKQYSQTGVRKFFLPNPQAAAGIAQEVRAIFAGA